MVIIYHKDNKVTSVFDFEQQLDLVNTKVKVADVLLNLAVDYPHQLLLWCNEEAKESLNTEGISDLFHHKKLIVSYAPHKNYLPDAIGYSDSSVTIKINKEVSYPTWQQSAFVGGMASELLLAVKEDLILDDNFDYFLVSLAKQLMPLGVLCYSEPGLLKQNLPVDYTKQASTATLFRFVKQHYRTRWIFLLLVDLFLYERRFPIFAFIFALFYHKRTLNGSNLDMIKVASTKKVVEKRELDVIIPTIGRKEYLYDVLKDFAAQTILPVSIIIVEQNPDPNSVTELDYIEKENWPFQIKHFFIHQTGACNARNLALRQTKSEWVFLADDDNRFSPDLLEKVFNNIEQYGVEVVTTSYLQKNEKKYFNTVFQWVTFGAGNSFVKRKYIESLQFNMGMEYGYGEDSDFGMQLRNAGADVIYFPNPEILHLKAPIGGFRTKPVLAWQDEKVQPKPSPTVMLFRLLHQTREQLLGYKTSLLYKHYPHQNIKNPFKYVQSMRKQWDASIYWAEILKNK